MMLLCFCTLIHSVTFTSDIDKFQRYFLDIEFLQTRKKKVRHLERSRGVYSKTNS